MGSFRIRRARLEDAEVLAQMGRAVHEESPELQGLTHNDAKLLNTLAHSTVEGQMDIGFFVCTLHGKVLGFVISERIAFFFGDDMYSVNNVIYVDPAYRGTRAGPLLVKAHIDWSYIVGCKQVFMNTITGIKPERTARLFNRLGFRQIGSIHKLEI